MTDHLPECPFAAGFVHHGCICTRLRACEARSYTLGIEVGKHDGWLAGHAAGVQAARDAVAAEREAAKLDYSAPYLLGMAAAIAAIDAMRGES